MHNNPHSFLVQFCGSCCTEDEMFMMLRIGTPYKTKILLPAALLQKLQMMVSVWKWRRVAWWLSKPKSVFVN